MDFSLNNMKKALWNAGAAIFWYGIFAALSFYLLGFFIFSSSCAVDEFEELYSPNKEMRAVVVMTGCGSLASPQTQIYVERIKSKSISLFSSKSTEYLIRLDGRPDTVKYKISWRGNDEFVISEFNFSDMMAFKNQSWGTELPRIYFELNGS